MKTQYFTDLMEKKGLNQVSLAKSLRLDRPTLNRILHGKRQLKLEEAVGLSGALEISLEDVLTAAGVNITPSRSDDVPIEGTLNEGFVVMKVTGVDRAPRPPGARGDLVAFKQPNGGLLYWQVQPGVDGKSCMGRLCVAELANGMTVVGTLTRSESIDFYDLELYGTQSQMKNVKVKRAGPVLWLKY